MRLTITIISGVLLSACHQPTAENQPEVNAPEPMHVVANEAGSANVANAAPEAPAPLAEPKGPIDPTSAEAAGQVVQHYGALIEQKRWGEAEKLWRQAEFARNFTAELRNYPELHLEIGKPGDMEGAAGSIFITEPVTFYGADKSGKPFRRSAEVTLRRVNDVPGSTKAQRRWHIDRIEWSGA